MRIKATQHYNIRYICKIVVVDNYIHISCTHKDMCADLEINTHNNDESIIIMIYYTWHHTERVVARDVPTQDNTNKQRQRQRELLALVT